MTEHHGASEPVLPRDVHVVPHTHWDREWYLPFQTFRLRLVDTLDALLRDLQADPTFTHFLLDGQMAAVDDYLAVRPDAEPSLRALAAAGRLTMGPWYTLPDEFLVSGETLVRDLQMGLARADQLGGTMTIGYLPDMFGHAAQMPQLLRLLGFEHAVVWRGVPGEATGRSGFWWKAVDGSTVRAEYLPTGYGNGATMPDDPEAFVARVESWLDEFGPPGDAPVLWMNGSDHLAHQPFLPEVLAKANAVAHGRLRFSITSLAEHLATAPTGDLPTVHGELRSSAKANLLMGVTSNRVDVRQAVARAERALERVAEPLHAALLPAVLWPQALLDEAWRQVVLNAAHDSVCACSHDEVVEAVLTRCAEARQIGDGLTDRALRVIGAALASPGAVAVNTTARARSGLVELTLPGDRVGPGEQLLEATPARRVLHELPADAAAVVLQQHLEIDPTVAAVDFVETEGDTVEVVITTSLAKQGRFAPGPTLHRMGDVAAQAPDRPTRIVLEQLARRRVLTTTGDVPGLGWAPLAQAPPPRPVTAEGRTLTNGVVTVEVDADGTFALDGHRGLGRLVDGGDAGDTYNWCPPSHDREVDRPDQVAVTMVEQGPLRARLRIDATYRWPARVDDATGSRVGEQAVAVATTLELRAGEPFVRATVAFTNTCEDHRLRAWFPLPRPATESSAECAFAVVRRGLTAEGGPTETGLPTFPSRRFVQAGGLTFVHEGLHEYELADVHDGAAHTLAVTLLRASRYLSRGPMATRPLPAGPVIELRGSQVLDRLELRYAVSTADVDPWVMADDVLVPLLVARGAGLGSLPDTYQGLAVEGAEVSAVLYRHGRLHVRAFHPGDGPATLRIPGRTGQIVDLRDRVVAPFTGSLDLAPGQIVTIRLDP